MRDREEGIERIREAAMDHYSHGFAFLTEKPFGEYIASSFYPRILLAMSKETLFGKNAKEFIFFPKCMYTP